MSALSHYRELGLLYGTYDIHCQYIKNLRTRLYEEFNKVAHELESIDSAELPIIRAAVGKYHLAMHTGDCRHKHSLHFMPGACMTDGETLERMWAILNALARRTKEMSAGHRHDVLNDTYADMNTRRLQGLGIVVYPDPLPLRADLCSVRTGRQAQHGRSVIRRSPGLSIGVRGKHRSGEGSSMASRGSRMAA